MPDTRSRPEPGEARNPRPVPDVCPYCGCPQHSPGVCEHCGAHTDPLSRQATQNEMGPWFIRDEAHPFRPGCRFETIERWARSGRITPETILRGPSTNQHWTPAARVPGVSRLLGRCHACGGGVEPTEVICAACGVSLEIDRDRQYLGLCPVRPLPGRAAPSRVASSLLNGGSTAQGPSTTPPALSAQTPPPDRIPPRDVPPSVPAKPGRLERRLRHADRRAAQMTVLAGLFAVLFAISLFINRSGPVPAEQTPVSVEAEPPAGVTPEPGEVAGRDASTEASPDRSAEASADKPEPAENKARVRLIARLDALLHRGTADALAEARRLIESDDVLSAEQRATWRRRLDLAEKADQRSALP